MNKIEKKLLNKNWKFIIINGILTNYLISSDGIVINTKTGKTLKGSPDKRGYIIISIWIDGKMYSKKLHRLVAETFIPNPENKPTVNHKDGIKTHNYVDNLEWATHKENIDHAIKTGLRNINGINSVSNIYTEEQVHEVCKLLESGKQPKEISELMHVSVNLPNRIKYLGKWKTISSKYNIKASNKIPKEKKKDAFNLMDQGIFDYDEIIRIINIPNTNESRKYLYALKWKYNKIKGSSTIKHSDVGGNAAS